MMKCMACGGGSLVEGVLSHSDTEKVQFRPASVSLLGSLFGAGNRPIRAYGCARCGHLQLAVDFTEEDLEKYQSFEGEQQPSAVDRPAGDPSASGS
ncbi:MAG TPA: hypothetical protein VKC34_07575 [Blastocatellia bacterium]|nr:hypothetical protein [Blastocatellia bacterium]